MAFAPVHGIDRRLGSGVADPRPRNHVLNGVLNRVLNPAPAGGNVESALHRHAREVVIAFLPRQLLLR